MLRVILMLSLMVGSLLLFPSQSFAQGCEPWSKQLIARFFPKQIDEQRLREFSRFTPEEWFQTASKHRKQKWLESAQARVSMPAVESKLRSALRKFYDVGFDLYGVRLDHEKLLIQPKMDANASANGSMINVNLGLLQYYINPVAYLVNIGNLPEDAFTSAEHSSARARFHWKNDWNSIYSVLAHEAAHNLMRHIDRTILTNVEVMFINYRRTVQNERENIARGRTRGKKRYIWQSLHGFFKEFDNSEARREREIEADTVALLLLQRTGFNPSIAIREGQKYLLLFSQIGESNPQGWQGRLTEALCSTHPDMLLRIERIQANLNCMQFSGELCEKHIAFPVGKFLTGLRNGMANLDEYHNATVAIAQGNLAESGKSYEVKVKTKPKDAQLMVDGEKADQGKLKLGVGPHILSASKQGFQTAERKIVVFPDFQPKVKLKLKKVRIRKNNPRIEFASVLS